MDAQECKTCHRCGQTKPKAEFGPNKARKDGVQVYCRSCMAEVRAEKQYDKTRWASKKDQESSRSAAYREANATRLREYWKEKAAKQRVENPGKKRLWNLQRKHGEKRATPPWAEADQINWFYFEAKRLQDLDGIVRHVDHIVPLKGGSVCGLHVQGNLQILTAAQNMAKRNRFTSDWS